MKTTIAAILTAVFLAGLTPQPAAAGVYGGSFCPHFPTIIWHCGPLETIIDTGSILVRTG